MARRTLGSQHLIGRRHIWITKWRVEFELCKWTLMMLVRTLMNWNLYFINYPLCLILSKWQFVHFLVVFLGKGPKCKNHEHILFKFQRRWERNHATFSAFHNAVLIWSIIKIKHIVLNVYLVYKYFIHYIIKTVPKYIEFMQLEKNNKLSKKCKKVCLIRF